MPAIHYGPTVTRPTWRETVIGSESVLPARSKSCSVFPGNVVHFEGKTGFFTFANSTRTVYRHNPVDGLMFQVDTIAPEDSSDDRNRRLFCTYKRYETVNGLA